MPAVSRKRKATSTIAKNGKRSRIGSTKRSGGKRNSRIRPSTKSRKRTYKRKVSYRRPRTVRRSRATKSKRRIFPSAGVALKAGPIVTLLDNNQGDQYSWARLLDNSSANGYSWDRDDPQPGYINITAANAAGAGSADTGSTFLTNSAVSLNGYGALSQSMVSFVGKQNGREFALGGSTALFQTAFTNAGLSFTGDNGASLVVQSVSHTLEFTNPTETDVKISFLWVKSKGRPQMGRVVGKVGDPFARQSALAAWYYGVDQLNGSTALDYNASVIGCYPTESPIFNQFWTITRKKYKKVKAGDTVVIKSVTDKKRVVKDNQICDGWDLNASERLIVLIHGKLGESTGNRGAEGGSAALPQAHMVGHVESRIMWNWRRKVRYAFVQNAAAKPSFVYAAMEQAEDVAQVAGTAAGTIGSSATHANTTGPRANTGVAAPNEFVNQLQEGAMEVAERVLPAVISAAATALTGGTAP